MTHMPPLKAFIDDTTVLTNSIAKAQTVLDRLQSLISWSRMKFKPAKSRSLSLQKGKIDASTVLHIDGQAIPTVCEQPVKSLGRWYDKSLKDTMQSQGVREEAE